jgi:hypothetical protein
MDQFTKQVIEGRVGSWAHVEPSLDGSKPLVAPSKYAAARFAALLGGTAQSTETSATAMRGGHFRGMDPRQVLCVTTDDNLLRAAKEVGFFTLKFRPSSDSLFGQVSTDFMATSSLEIQDAVEEMNGVGLRQSAFRHRAF